MRWDRLFADLEAQADDLELAERDALVHELRDGEWADLGWVELLGGRAVLEVRGVGRLEGEVLRATPLLVHLRAGHVHHVVATTAVLAVLDSEHRAEPAGVVADRTGWGPVLRAARDDGDLVRLTRVDGTACDATVDVVGGDFVRVVTEAGRRVVLPMRALATVSFS